ncbi:MAG: hypothetical protein J6J42_05380 [Lachnospiraceae bacterium]|nr:hypothetical protein [Lachnospiraceae bacterium]MBP3609751.1 hypothetical protein [Lachnospiraceae bacterium]
MRTEAGEGREGFASVLFYSEKENQQNRTFVLYIFGVMCYDNNGSNFDEVTAFW